MHEPTISLSATDLGGPETTASATPWSDLATTKSARTVRGWRRWLDPAFGDRANRVWALDRADQLNPFWWPQGLAAAPDTSEATCFLGTAYAKDHRGRNQGSRLTYLRLGAERVDYEHVLLLDPSGAPLRIHAGGVVWTRDWIYVAATKAGLYAVPASGVEAIPPRSHFGTTYRWAVTATRHWRPLPGSERPFRFSFCSTTADSTTSIVCGEYERDGHSTRLLLLPTSEDGELGDGENVLGTVLGLGLPRIQGAVRVGSRWWLSQSRGRLSPGHLFTGEPGRWQEQRRALPAGPEDLTYVDGQLWGLAEHPGRRWLYGVGVGANGR